MKKTALWLAAILLITMAACSNNKNNETTTQEETTREMVTYEPTSDKRNEELEQILTPKGAEVVTQEKGTFSLRSTQSLEELINFYQAATAENNIREEIITDVVGWSFIGKYDGNKTLTIVIGERNNDQHSIRITY